jgi:hypothetical protein
MLSSNNLRLYFYQNEGLSRKAIEMTTIIQKLYEVGFSLYGEPGFSREFA